jgi:hypothetical protein
LESGVRRGTENESESVPAAGIVLAFSVVFPSTSQSLEDGITS